MTVAQCTCGNWFSVRNDRKRCWFCDLEYHEATTDAARMEVNDFYGRTDLTPSAMYPARHITRFWSKVAITDPDQCWNWKTCCYKNGYGSFKFKGISKYAHRVVWEIVNGEIPDGLHVLHECDNPPCVNPHHLFLGTHQDNMKDRNAKGRQRCGRGERHAHRKLTTEQVIEIRRRYSTGQISMRKLAKEFGVSSSHVTNIVGYKRRQYDIEEAA